MTSEAPGPTAALSGRIRSGPSELLHDEVLAPQFRFESRHLLHHYAAIEKTLTAEYARMGLVTADEAGTSRPCWTAWGQTPSPPSPAPTCRTSPSPSNATSRPGCPVPSSAGTWTAAATTSRPARR
ncbi:hypothetical protein ACFSNO_31495 [Streptomyces cirratus]